jgi:cytochrome c oxidase subunit 2
VSLTPSAPRGRGAHVPGLAPAQTAASSPGRGRGARWRRALPLAALLAVVVPGLAGCTSNAFTRLGMPVPVTKQGQVTLTLWQGSWIAAWAVGAVVWGLIIWAIIFHRKRGDQPPHQVRYNLPIEMLYTVVPFIMIGVLFYFTARDENFINKLSARPDVVVNVVGYQWSWQFQYPQYTVPKSVTGHVVINGEPWLPGQGSRDLPLLVIPTNRTVRFNLTSTDVIHAFWIVPFEFKRDVIPGHPNHFQVTPIRTGTFIGRCTELCGLYHSRMLFVVKIVTPAQFRVWISRQQAAQQKAAGSAQ